MQHVLKKLDHPSDIIPYLALLAESIRSELSDQKVEVHRHAAEILGALAKKVGLQSEAHFRFLYEILEDSQSSESLRLGAAHGLAEVVCSLNILSPNFLLEWNARMLDRVERSGCLLVRNGYLSLFLFVPYIKQKRLDFTYYLQ